MKTEEQILRENLERMTTADVINFAFERAKSVHDLKEHPCPVARRMAISSIRSSLMASSSSNPIKHAIEADGDACTARYKATRFNKTYQTLPSRFWEDEEVTIERENVQDQNRFWDEEKDCANKD